MSFPADYREKLLATLSTIDTGRVAQAIEWMKEARDANRALFVAGNGGSSATAAHFVCDMVKGASMGKRARFRIVALGQNLPTLTVVANNQSWLAVRQSTLDVFPDGHAAKANVMALTELKPSPDYEKVIETCGGRGEKVEAPGDLVPALRRGLEAVRAGTPTTLNVLTQARR